MGHDRLEEGHSDIYFEQPSFLFGLERNAAALSVGTFAFPMAEEEDLLIGRGQQQLLKRPSAPSVPRVLLEDAVEGEAERTGGGVSVGGSSASSSSGSSTNSDYLGAVSGGKKDQLSPAIPIVAGMRPSIHSNSNYRISSTVPRLTVATSPPGHYLENNVAESLVHQTPVFGTLADLHDQGNAIHPLAPPPANLSSLHTHSLPTAAMPRPFGEFHHYHPQQSHHHNYDNRHMQIPNPPPPPSTTIPWSQMSANAITHAALASNVHSSTSVNADPTPSPSIVVFAASPRSINDSLFSFKASPKASAEQQVERQRRRKENHNAVERRRRDHINDMIQKLALLCTATSEGPDYAAAGKLNKGEILEMAVKRIVLLQQTLHHFYRRLVQVDPAFVPSNLFHPFLSTLLLSIPETDGDSNALDQAQASIPTSDCNSSPSFIPAPRSPHEGTTTKSTVFMTDGNTPSL